MKLLLLGLCCLVSADKLKFKTSKLQSEQCQNGAVNDTVRDLLYIHFTNTNKETNLVPTKNVPDKLRFGARGLLDSTRY